MATLELDFSTLFSSCTFLPSSLVMFVAFDMLVDISAVALKSVFSAVDGGTTLSLEVFHTLLFALTAISFGLTTSFCDILGCTFSSCCTIDALDPSSLKLIKMASLLLQLLEVSTSACMHIFHFLGFEHSPSVPAFLTLLVYFHLTSFRLADSADDPSTISL